MHLPTLVITGPPVVGKSLMTACLMEHDYATTIDTGSLVRAELAAEGSRAPTRAEQAAYASKMIRQHGGGYFTDQLIKTLPGPHLIDGPRRRIEIEHLLSTDCVLLFLDADAEVRYRRCIGRATDRDKLSRDEFMAQDRLEWGFDPTPGGHEVVRGDPYERDLSFARDHAHAWFNNDRPQEVLRVHIAMFVEDLMAGRIGPGSPWRPKVYRESAPLG